jgi:hypothetical protein
VFDTLWRGEEKRPWTRYRHVFTVSSAFEVMSQLNETEFHGQPTMMFPSAVGITDEPYVSDHVKILVRGKVLETDRQTGIGVRRGPR